MDPELVEVTDHVPRWGRVGRHDRAGGVEVGSATGEVAPQDRLARALDPQPFGKLEMAGADREIEVVEDVADR